MLSLKKLILMKFYKSFQIWDNVRVALFSISLYFKSNSKELNDQCEDDSRLIINFLLLK